MVSKTELAKIVSIKAGITKKDAEKAVNAVFDTIKETLINAESVQIIGFGTFETSVQNARECRNPQTGEKISVPAKTVPKFKAGKSLKDAVVKRSH